MPHASEETWSDSESEADDVLETPLRSYAYQIEMFEQSLQGNIIAVVGTFRHFHSSQSNTYIDGHRNREDSSVSFPFGSSYEQPFWRSAVLPSYQCLHCVDPII